MMRSWFGLVLSCALSLPVAAQENPTVTIPRTEGPIAIDGVLDEVAWKSAARYDTWFETNPGDNIEPQVQTVGYVMYDSRFLYVGFEASDPNPREIRAVFGDHDQISGNSDDFMGVIIDSRNDGKTAIEFFVTARGVKYDAVIDDTSGNEDSSPDFFWDSAAKIHERGWTLEMRIPFSSLRYDNPDPDEWGLILYRNRPRERRYQMFTNRLPRGVNCLVCQFGKVTGLRELPSGDHLVVAPYVTARHLSERGPVLGGGLDSRGVGTEAGLDLKWNPTADMAVDATVNPDFSQVESDVAVISTNERFAIFIPEKRPFFLEGVEHFATPIRAVYTRTITSPDWGARTTGRTGSYGYTFLVTQDEGGGSVIVPSPFGSSLALQDASSIAAIGRIRRDFGRSFIGLLATTREGDGSAHNRVIGPDFEWRRSRHTVRGQFLYSDTETPNRPELHREWTGQSLAGHAGHIRYVYSAPTRDFYLSYSDYDDEFRADNGFVPQVGYRGSYGEAGHTWRPKGFFSRVRLYGQGEYQTTRDGDLLYSAASAGVNADGRYRSFSRLRFARESVANAGEIFDRNRVYYVVQFAVSRVLNLIALDGWVGDDVDFVRNRSGNGANVNLTVQLRPSDRLQTSLSSSVRWLSLSGDRLFTSQVERLRATYSFNERMFLRTIVQNQRTNRDRDLYGLPVDQHSGTLSSQILFAYKLNWQTVFYIGYGDLQEVTPADGDLRPANRQVFTKVSYAFQR